MLLVAAIVIGVLVWVGRGALAYALTLAYFQRKYPLSAAKDYQDDRSFARWFGFTGPIGLFIALMEGKGIHYGLKWR